MRLLSCGGLFALVSACTFSGGVGETEPESFPDASIPDAADPPPGFSLVSLSFRDGPTYAGTRDNWLFEEDSGSRGNRDVLNWDREHSEGGFIGIGVDRGESVTLVGFEIFGDAADRVPPGARIARALLVLVITDGSGRAHRDVRGRHRLGRVDLLGQLGSELRPQAGEDYIEASRVPFETGGVDGPITLDVTVTVQRWSDGALANNGWLFRALSDNGTDVRSSEFDDENQRPLLRVDYLAPE